MSATSKSRSRVRKRSKAGVPAGAELPKYRGMSLVEKELFIAEHLHRGIGVTEISREMGYANHSMVSRMIATPGVQSRLQAFRTGVLVASGPAAEGAPVEAEVNIEDLTKLAVARMAELLQFGTFLGRPVDPKDGVRAIYEALDRNEETGKTKRQKDPGRGKRPGRGLGQERLRQLEKMAANLGGQVLLQPGAGPH